jgi:hypothetical protein
MSSLQEKKLPRLKLEMLREIKPAVITTSLDYQCATQAEP